MEPAQIEALHFPQVSVEPVRPKKSADTSIGAGSLASGEDGLDFVSEIGRKRILRSGCPHCGTNEVRPWGKAGGVPRYRCKVCRKTFNAFTATPVAGLHHKDRWLDQARSLIEGETLAQAAERCQVDPSTAYRWRRRFLAAVSSEKPKSFSGIVEADVALIPESLKGRKRGLPRPARTRGSKANEHDVLTEQIPVVVARDRRGATFDAVLPSRPEVTKRLDLTHKRTNHELRRPSEFSVARWRLQILWRIKAAICCTSSSIVPDRLPGLDRLVCRPQDRGRHE